MTMAKKQQGGATAEREAGPIESLGELIDRASLFTDADVTALKKAGHAFCGGFHGALDLGKAVQVGGRLEPEESDSLRRLFLALDRSNTRLANGKPIVYAIDVVRWMLEQTTRQIGERAEG
jgi:hypothetical protein